jgi:hypothetical protein
MLQHSNSANEMLLRRKLEEQQQAVELQQAIELQSRRLMGLQLLDLKSRSSAAAAPTPIGNPFSPKHTTAASPNQSPPDSGKDFVRATDNTHHITCRNNNRCSVANVSCADFLTVGEQGNGCGFLFPHKAVNGADKDESSGDSTSPNTDSDQRWNLTLNKSQSSSPFVSFHYT